MNKNINIKSITLIGLFIALTFLGASIIKIPTFGGYVHLGDCMVLMSAVILGPKKGAFASGVGMVFTDILGGYAVWAPFTFVIKVLMALTAGIIIEKMSKKNTVSYLYAFIPACLVMVIGYFISGIIVAGLLSGTKLSLLNASIFASKDIIGNFLQAGVGIVIAIPLCNLLLKTKMLTAIEK